MVCVIKLIRFVCITVCCCELVNGGCGSCKNNNNSGNNNSGKDWKIISLIVNKSGCNVTDDRIKSLNIEGDVEKTLDIVKYILKNGFNKDLVTIFKLDSELFNNIINNTVTFNCNCQTVENQPYIVAIIKLINGDNYNHYLVYSRTCISSTASFFNNMNNLICVKIIKTGKITSCKSMFNMCKKLENVDLSGLDTSECTNMRLMFYGCQVLKSLDLRNFNTEKVTDMDGMFVSMNEIEILDLGSFRTEKIKTIINMFSACQKLKFLNIANFSENTIIKPNAFSGCRSLEEVHISNPHNDTIDTLKDIGIEKTQDGIFKKKAS